MSKLFFLSAVGVCAASLGFSVVSGRTASIQTEPAPAAATEVERVGLACSGLGPDARKVVMHYQDGLYHHSYVDSDGSVVRTTEPKPFTISNNDPRSPDNLAATDFCLNGLKPLELRGRLSEHLPVLRRLP